MEECINDKVREIKKSLRLAMNGVVSTLQRRQGLDYRINFGVEIPRLKGIAAKYFKSRHPASPAEKKVFDKWKKVCYYSQAHRASGKRMYLVN